MESIKLMHIDRWFLVQIEDIVRLEEQKFQTAS